MAGQIIQYQTEDGVTVICLQASDGKAKQIEPAKPKTAGKSKGDQA